MIDLVADTNIVFSALLKRGRIREIILLRGNLKLHAPAELREELYRHIHKLQRYLNLSREEMKRIIDRFLEETTMLHRKEEYARHLPRALEIVKNVDLADAPFVALAMHLGVPLWTGDRGLLRLSAETGFRYFTAIDTEGAEMLLEGAPLEEVRMKMKKKYEAGI
ncbi:MAG: PIN domain-containing protein [Desulfurococcales archaeon]|nr:PIN domain-containing protein [Desulfurococcales archaeon]